MHRAYLIALLPLAACSTQRYGRATEVSPAEERLYTCHDIAVEQAKVDEFLNTVRDGRDHTSYKHVGAVFADLGIGNYLEGEEAEKSGVKRQDELRRLAAMRNCPAS